MTATGFMGSLGVDNLWLFMVTGVLLNLSPGPDVLYIMASGARSKAAGIVASLGITAGCFVHVAAAAIGLSALIAASSTAFTLLKWLGAAYLVYVGLTMVFSRKITNATDNIANYQANTGAIGLFDGQSDLTADSAVKTAVNPAVDLKAVFLRGFWTNVLNPKVALFFLAFLPQFVLPDAPHKTLSFVLLGLIFNLNALPINLAYGVGAAWAARRLGAARAGFAWLERGAGALFVYFGVRLALSDNQG